MIPAIAVMSAMRAHQENDRREREREENLRRARNNTYSRGTWGRGYRRTQTNAFNPYRGSPQDLEHARTSNVRIFPGSRHHHHHHEDHREQSSSSSSSENAEYYDARRDFIMWIRRQSMEEPRAPRADVINLAMYPGAVEDEGEREEDDSFGVLPPPINCMNKLILTDIGIWRVVYKLTTYTIPRNFICNLIIRTTLFALLSLCMFIIAIQFESGVQLLCSLSIITMSGLQITSFFLFYFELKEETHLRHDRWSRRLVTATFTNYLSFLIYFTLFIILLVDMSKTPESGQVLFYFIIIVSIPNTFFHMMTVWILYTPFKLLFYIIFFLFLLPPYIIYSLCCKRKALGPLMKEIFHVQSPPKPGHIDWAKITDKFAPNKYSTHVCAICLTEFGPDEEIAVLGCNQNHIFHIKCIQDWAKKQTICPYCKRDIM